MREGQNALLDIITGLLVHSCDSHYAIVGTRDGQNLYRATFSTGPVTANLKAIRRLVAEGRAEIISETTQRLVFHLVPRTECRHGVSLDHDCNGCSDSGDDPRKAVR